MSKKEILIQQYETLTDWLLNQLKLVESLIKQVNSLTNIANNISDTDAQDNLYEQIIILHKTLGELTEEVVDTWAQYKNNVLQIKGWSFL